MAISRGGKPPNQAVLRAVRRNVVVVCSKNLADCSPVLQDAGYPSFALDLEKVSWTLEKVSDQMQARLEQP